MSTKITVDTLKSGLEKLTQSHGMDKAIKALNKNLRKGNITFEQARAIAWNVSCELGKAFDESASHKWSQKNMLVIPESKSSKLGMAVTTYSYWNTCPNDCPLLISGACYTMQGKTRMHVMRSIDMTDKRFTDNSAKLIDLTIEGFIAQADKDPDNNSLVFRLGSSGDLALYGTNQLNTEQFDTIAWCVHKAFEVVSTMYPNREFKLVFTSYTHCAQSLLTDKAIKAVHEKYQATMNYSAKTLVEVESAVRANMPVCYATGDIEGDRAYLKAHGIKSIVCPNQTRGLTCAQCKLCGKFDRNAVVIFSMHGAKAKAGAEIIAQLNATAIPAKQI